MRGVVSLSFLNIPLLLAPGNLANIDWFNPLWLSLLQKFLAFNWKMHLENALAEICIATVHLFTLNSCKSTAPFCLLREATLHPRSAPLAEYIAEKSISSLFRSWPQRGVQPLSMQETSLWVSFWLKVSTFCGKDFNFAILLLSWTGCLSPLCFALFKFTAEKLLERI